MPGGALDVAPSKQLLYSGHVGKTRHLELQRPISNTATWRSGDAADCKSKGFANPNSAHSEKARRFHAIVLNRLGDISERGSRDDAGTRQ